jgi:hypothetical protein
MNKIFIIFLLFTTSIYAQTSVNSKQDKAQTYYWFNIKLGKTSESGTSSGQLRIRNVEDAIYSGTFDDFIQSNESGMRSGSVVVGPFSERHQAEGSQWIYRNAGKPINNKSKSDTSEFEPSFSYFFVKPISEDFNQTLNFERIPSRVTVGVVDEFSDMLGEGLNFEKLAIGPFDSYELAEKSKFIFRKNDQTSTETQVDTLSKKNLEAMAKKWKSLDFKITKQSEDKLTRTLIYRFSTTFPRFYFSPDAFQIITITASYSDSFNTSSSSFTLQGDNVLDNNYIISTSMSTIYINLLQFDDNKPAKINGFLFESFIYNDSEIIRLDPVYITVK